MRLSGYRHIATLPGAVIALGILGGCEKQSAQTPAVPPPLSVANLVVISPHGPAIRDVFTDEFSAWHTDQTGQPVSVQWQHMGTVDCKRYIVDRYAQYPEVTDIGLDVFFGGGVAIHRDLALAGYAQSIELPEDLLSTIPAELNGQPLRAADGSWYGTALGGFGILYNRTACAARRIPPPQTWADLATPAYQGWVAAADPATSGSTLQCLVLVLLKHGWDDGWGIVTGILANCNGLCPSSSLISPTVASGMAVAGLEPEFVARMNVAASPDTLVYVNPPAATAITPDPITVLKGARNLEVARRFVEFVLSKEGQKLWALKPDPPEEGDTGAPVRQPLHRYPIRPDVYELGDKLVVEENPFQEGLGMEIDVEAEAAYTRLLSPLLTAACGGNHLLLQQAWRAAAARGANSQQLAELKKPPFDEEQALEYARECAESRERQAELEVQWTEQFRQRYEAILTPATTAAR